MIVCPKVLPKPASLVLKGNILPELKQDGLLAMNNLQIVLNRKSDQVCKDVGSQNSRSGC
jgi:hypothetical protein